MGLTKQTADTFIRRLASAANYELEEIAQDLSAIAHDTEQAGDVRFVARRLSSTTRGLIKTR